MECDRQVFESEEQFDLVERVVKFTEPFEIVSRFLRHVNDSGVVQLSFVLYKYQDFETFKELVKERLGWELNLKQKINRRGDTMRWVYMCSAIKC